MKTIKKNYISIKHKDWHKYARIYEDEFEVAKKPEKTDEDPIQVFEKAVKNITPLVEVKARRIGGSTYQVPLEVNRYRGTTLALRWLIKAASDRSGRTTSLKLASEIMDASSGVGNAVRKREETHRMAEANKAFAHFRY